MSSEAAPQIKPERNGPQRDQAYGRLRQILILHQAPEGKRLNEELWASRLKVNRSALREAFARLEAEGLIEKGALPGYFVPKLTRADLTEIVEVRIMLEGGAIDRICRRGLNTLGNLGEVQRACDRLARLADGGQYAEIAQADREYHEALVMAARNRRLTTLYQRAPLPIIPPEVVHGSEWVSRVEQTVQEHRTMIDCMLEGDIGRAVAALRIHLRERLLIPLRVV
jgi:DNA-binding GntR family transcriptional regulator